MVLNKSNRVLLVGPNPDFITGQSVAFKYLIDASKNRSDYVRICFNSSGNSFIDKIIGFIFYFFKLIYLFIGFRPATVYLTNSRTKLGLLRDVCVFSLAKLFSSKVIVHLHGSEFKTFIKTLPNKWRKLANWGYSQVNTGVVLSSSMSAQFDIYEHIDVVVIENCFSPELIEFKCNKISGPLKVLFLSNLMHTKGIIELIEAVKEINLPSKVVELKIAGSYLADGSYSKQNIKSKVESLLDDNIEYYGVVRGSDKNKLLNWCNIVALPSYYPTEAQPIVLIEGLAAGRYLLTSTAGYISEFVKHLEHGFVLDNVSANEITKALKYLLANHEHIEKISQENLNYAVQRFSQQGYVNKVFEIIGVNI